MPTSTAVSSSLSSGSISSCALDSEPFRLRFARYTQLHNEFKQLFEDRLNSFLFGIGATPEAFYVAFEKAGHEGVERCFGADSGSKERCRASRS